MMHILTKSVKKPIFLDICVQELWISTIIFQVLMLMLKLEREKSTIGNFLMKKSTVGIPSLNEIVFIMIINDIKNHYSC